LKTKAIIIKTKKSFLESFLVEIYPNLKEADLILENLGNMFTEKMLKE